MASVAVGTHCPNDARLVTCVGDDAGGELVGYCDTCGTRYVQAQPSELGKVGLGDGPDPHKPASVPTPDPYAFAGPFPDDPEQDKIDDEPGNPNDEPAPDVPSMMDKMLAAVGLTHHEGEAESGEKSA